MKRILLILLFFVLCIEVSMRIAIWRALDEIVPENATYRMEVILRDNTLTWGCSSYGNEENRYMNVSYSLWFISILESKMFCEYQSPHIILRVISSENIDDYYWSFHHMGFEQDRRYR
ncbi:hypothetical protein [Escherichia coli]|uniref:hypothetical protein n=1 Tax=Escherichia coli TaxID=562 RepID=UPI000DDBC7B1|nr:hypothetical protein [Escherichia coli]MBS9006125.1 hypothetical protein [Escherichia coli]MDI4462485.1 hypothetical protein [Escherichia coli]